ncbi:hypothetical protein MmiAt1_13280 [Methanimicrococcus sp. At1]|uniref:Uncharacterized protein n=1 Tax=Methanimicrococcus hacksteinii TaxID=3028293 RepID=A0ABU3VR04_9EURY|nr:hypothetical protein [Methanimicrococcus sp. At1]MDV0445734.1 hypothetical protein [Methanimicrococcus sp. At1]
MNIKYLLGSFLILLVAASAITPALGAGNVQNHSNAKFMTLSISDDEQSKGMFGVGNVHFEHFELSDEEGRTITIGAHFDGLEDVKFVKVSLSEYDPDEMKLLDEMNAEEREAYFLARYKEHLDIEVEAGNLTQEEADQMYAERETGENVHVSLFASSSNLTVLTEEELEALKNMTEDEKEAFFLEQFKQSLSEAVASGSLTQEDADQMLEARESGTFSGFVACSDGGAISVKMRAPLSEEELSALQDMTADDKKDFFLSQIKANLDADVAAGRLTQEEADEIYAHHQSGSEGYTKSRMFHTTASFRTNEAVIAE